MRATASPRHATGTGDAQEARGAHAVEQGGVRLFVQAPLWHGTGVEQLPVRLALRLLGAAPAR
jgi:hypothetical protein